MKTLLKARILKLVKDESGIAMPMALIILVIGGMLIIPFVYFSELNLKTDVTTREFNERVYAADAGVQWALWNFKYNSAYTKPAVGSSAPLTFNDAAFSGKTINVTVLNEGVTGYRITSVASDSEGSNSIVAYVSESSSLDFSSIMDNAITSLNDITIKPGTTVIGSVQYNGELENQGTLIGSINPDPVTGWPTASQLISYYSNQTASLAHVPAGTHINISSGTESSPYLIVSTGGLYAEGDLDITGSGVAKLNGLLYVKGDLEVEPGNEINLNGQTIFAEGEIRFQPNSIITGTGCIIAIGDILFQPNMSPGNRLVGAEENLTPSSYATGNQFILERFQAVQTGDMLTFRVYCGGTGNIKLAIYTDVSGSPGVLVNAMNDSIPITTAGWNDIVFPRTSIGSGTWYWLAGNSSASIIGRKSVTGSSYLYKAATFSSFSSFPQPFNPTDFVTASSYKLLFAGHEHGYILALSVSNSSTIKPNGSFYGTIAGRSEVEIMPGSQLKWIQPGSGLNFPTGGGGSGGTGGGFTLVRYVIQ